MNNIKKYDEFINEGMFSGIKNLLKKLDKNPEPEIEKELDSTIKDIISEIKDKFDPEKLSVEPHKGNTIWMCYKLGNDVIRTCGSSIQINSDFLTDYVNSKYPKELDTFLNKESEKKNEKKKVEDKENLISGLKDKYSKK